MLISLVGGRIVPSFTRNWLARENPGRLPVPFGRFDMLVVVASAAALALLGRRAASARGRGRRRCSSAGIVQSARSARWAGDRTAHERLVLICILATHLFRCGFLTVGLAAFDLVPAAAGVHAWAGGAVGTMTLAVMTRASLGHTGRALVASVATQAIYVAVVLATVSRIAAAIGPAHSMPLLIASAALWAGAFLGFGVAYGPILVANASRNDK